MLCARYGPVALEYVGGRVRLAEACEKYVELDEFVKSIKVEGPLIALLGIRRGAAASYSAVAKALGLTPRAVGKLLAKNPLPVILPCHRVVYADGRLGGYEYGVEVKRALLRHEGALCGDRACRLSGVEPVEGDVYAAILKSLGLNDI
jgi:methylated-DNA-[protein]-cysteine S-methyltransferase